MNATRLVESNCPRRRLFWMTTGLLLVALEIPSNPAHGQFYNPGSTILGKSIAEWSADYQEWNWNLPASLVTFENAHAGAILRYMNDAPVYFLDPLNFNAARSITVPAGKPILFPLANAAYVRSPEEVDVEDIPVWWSGNPVDGVRPPSADFTRDATTSIVDTVEHVELTLDGVTLAEPEIRNYRESIIYMHVTTNADNHVGDAVGTWPESFADGYYVMLQPLSPGDHTLNYQVEFSAFGLSPRFEETLTLSAVPEPSTIGLALAGASAAVAAFGRRGRREVQGS